MVLEAIWIGLAFCLGLIVRLIGLPPLVGYLVAGFAISYANQNFGLPSDQGVILEHIAHLGVILLLFTVGLKLNLKNIFKSEIIGPGFLHFFIITGLYFFVCSSVFEQNFRTSLYLAMALSFSSTVLSAKVLEGKKELQSFHGKVAIGILILQDLIALVIMSSSTGETPSPYALGLLLLPFLRPLLYKVLEHTGKDDLLVLFGLLLAVVIGGYGFKLLGLSSELGALAMGMMMAKHPRASEISKSLWSIKEFFLIGFFLKIGVAGLPSTQDWIFAAVINSSLILKGALFFGLLVAFKLRARSSFLSALSLSAFSEFGLIVASIALPEWLTPLALCVTISFIISAPLNAFSHQIYERFYKSLNHLERNTRHPDEQIIFLGDAQVLIMGLGRTGRAAYQQLSQQGDFLIAGMDSDLDKVEYFKEEKNMNVYFGDAEDPLFWEKLDLGRVRSVLLCISEMDPKIEATKKLRHRGFKGMIATHCMDQNEADTLKQNGIDRTYLTLSEAGVSLAKCLG